MIDHLFNRGFVNIFLAINNQNTITNICKKSNTTYAYTSIVLKELYENNVIAKKSNKGQIIIVLTDKGLIIQDNLIRTLDAINK